MLTKFDIDHINDIMVDAKHYNWFSAKLLRLMADADMANLRKLATAFPDVFLAFANWKWQGVPYYFYGYVDISGSNLSWLNPEGKPVKPYLIHARDF